MSFDNKYLATVGPHSANTPTIWAYYTDDAITTVEASGYVDDKKYQMMAGDFIYVYCNSVAYVFDILTVSPNVTVKRNFPMGVGWEDLQVGLVGRNLESAAGTVSINWNEAGIDFSPSGNIATAIDRVVLASQAPHKMVTDGNMHLHFHWEQVDAVARQFTYQYRIQVAGQAKADWGDAVNVTADATTNAFPYTSGTLNQITPIAVIPFSGKGLSAVLQVRFTRSDAVAGDIIGTFLDLHYPSDSDGSRLEYTK